MEETKLSLLEVNNVRKTYTSRLGENTVEALKGVNFSVESGEYIAIMGESGSGKTTLLNILAALDRPTSGEVRLNGINLVSMKEKEISIPTDLAGSILFFLLGAVLFFMLPSQVPISENDVINGRVFPKLLFSLMMICSAVLIIQNIIKISKKQPVQVSTFNLLTEVKALMILTILFITYFICRITDLFVLGAIFCSIAFLVYLK